MVLISVAHHNYYPKILYVIKIVLIAKHLKTF
jgi:hypothetical protein